MIKNILVIGHSNIGDVCYDLAVIDPLKKNFPEAKISFLSSSRTHNLVEGYEGIDSVLTFDRKKGVRGIIHRVRLILSLRKKKFDLAVSLKNTFMSQTLGITRSWNVRTFLGCKFSDKKMHIADIYREFLEANGVKAPEVIFRFKPEENSFCDAFFKAHDIKKTDTLIGILPLAAWPLKSWPPDKWRDLAQNLKARYSAKVIALGKKSDFDKHPLLRETLASQIIIADQTTLKQALALIKRCTLFIGPDSGFLHLASCMGVQAIGLYGPTPHDYIYPYFHQKNIVSPTKKFPCLPCYPGLQACVCEGKFEFGKCMESISVDDVLKKVALTLSVS
jgi:ADP-heptose:LPS heptosyltransferase